MYSAGGPFLSGHLSPSSIPRTAQSPKKSVVGETISLDFRLNNDHLNSSPSQSGMPNQSNLISSVASQVLNPIELTMQSANLAKQCQAIANAILVHPEIIFPEEIVECFPHFRSILTRLGHNVKDRMAQTHDVSGLTFCQHDLESNILALQPFLFVLESVLKISKIKYTWMDIFHEDNTPLAGLARLVQCHVYEGNKYTSSIQMIMSTFPMDNQSRHVFCKYLLTISGIQHISLRNQVAAWLPPHFCPNLAS